MLEKRLWSVALAILVFLSGCSSEEDKALRNAMDAAKDAPVQAVPEFMASAELAGGKLPGDGIKSSTADADSFFSSLTEADIGYAVPPKMEEGRTELVELVLGVDATREEIVTEFSSEGSISFASVAVAPVIEARLTGQGFSVLAITEEKQPVSRKIRTRWAWQVKPLLEGTHNLHLSLSSTVLIGEVRTPTTLRTFDRQITVSVDPSEKVKGFIKKNWQWLWSAILIPIFGWLWSRRVRTRRGAN